MKCVVMALVVFLLVSCSEITYQPTTTGAKEIAIPPTAIVKPETFATETQLLTTETVVATPVVVPVLDDLPSWIKDPNKMVLAALITDDLKGVRNVAFFNPATGEKYEISMPKAVSGFFWYDNMNFGLLSQDLKTAYRLNFQTAQVNTEIISSQSTRLLDKDEVNGLVRFRELGNDFIFDKVSYSSTSKDKTFLAQWIDSQKNVVVTDTRTKEVVWQSATAENFWVTDFVWSPIDDGHLAFLQGSPKVYDNYVSDYVTEDISLTIVNVTNGEIVSTYAGNFGGLSWSPDGKKILYQDPLVHYNNYGVLFQDAPCLLFLATSEKLCLRAIPRLVPEGYRLETTRNYKWGINSETILYTYVYSSQSEEKTLGNLCSYSLITSYITCPTQNLEVLHGHSIGEYDVSPNQEYIHFCYWNDNKDFAIDGIINFDGKGFFSWTGAIQDRGPTVCSFDTLWRPLP